MVSLKQDKQQYKINKNYHISIIVIWIKAIHIYCDFRLEENIVYQPEMLINLDTSLSYDVKNVQRFLLLLRCIFDNFYIETYIDRSFFQEKTVYK